MMLEKDLIARTEAVLLATIVTSMVGTMAMLYLFYSKLLLFYYYLKTLFHLCYFRI
jgi:hypothetical protein